MKERIIGAAILVLFVVSVVPVFLDGPPADGEVISERVLLPGQEEQDTKTVVLDRDRSVPIPATGVSQVDTVTKEELPSPDSDKPLQKSEPATLTPGAAAPNQQAELESELQAEEKAQQNVSSAPSQSPADNSAQQNVSSASTASESTTGMWAVQMGSFSERQNAEKLAADLRKQGFAAFLSKLTKDGAELHRVRIGPQKNRESAENTAAGLLKVGHKGQVVPHP